MKLAWVLCAVQVASAAGPIELSLKRAVEVAVSPEGNTRIQLSGEALKQAQSRSAQQGVVNDPGPGTLRALLLSMPALFSGALSRRRALGHRANHLFARRAPTHGAGG